MSRVPMAQACTHEMRRRVMALVLTVVVAGTPAAFAMCQLVCASSTPHGDAESRTHSGHAGHRSSVPISDASIDDEGHRCGGHGDLSALVAPSPERTIAAAILTTGGVVLPSLPLASIHVDITQASRSPSVPLHTPLRI